jgi:hypothetical protein
MLDFTGLLLTTTEASVKAQLPPTKGHLLPMAGGTQIHTIFFHDTLSFYFVQSLINYKT